ncbi:MAG: SgcJ/EcaC family oxidoreductase [Planctomyces sp.]|nr:SgcJ/EcaC family oxidoreductase [Planctomyces sp.]
MRSKTFACCLTVAALMGLPPLSVRAQQNGAQASSGQTTSAPKEAAIRAAAEEFVKAYNAHDAKAVAQLFLPQAQVIDENDNTIQGRENIEQVFADVFAEQPDTGISINIESIRFIGTNLALEMGSSTTVPPEGEVPETGRYTVVHVLNDGKWSMGLVRDVPAEPSARDHLETLAWLVGEWVDESRDSRVHTSCRWSDNENFLLQEISVRQGDLEVMKISQRIGWDPLRKQIKTWVFDSAGGYGESYWTPTETGWLIKATSVNSDGSTASATNHIEPVGIDRFVFQSVDRVSGNEVLEAIQVTVVRQPPLPSGIK